MFDTEDVLTLDDGKDYVVVRELTLKDKKYLCLAEFENPKQISFTSYFKKGEDVFFEDVEDPDIMMELMKLIHDEVMGETA